MKKLIFIFSLAALSFTVNAQNSAVTNAALYHQDGKLDKALTEINNAVNHEKTKEEAKTWYIRGLIYHSLASSEKPEYQTIAAGAEKEALVSYKKAMSLDPKQGEYYRNSKINLQALYPAVINKGTAEYQSNKFKEALESFELAQEINPQDSLGYIYGAYAAEGLKRYDLIKKYLSKLDEIGFRSEQTYLYKIVIANEIDKDPAKALQVATEGVNHYPASLGLLQEQTNLLISLKKHDEAIQNINRLITLNPGNVQYYTMLASLYDRKDDKEKALENYNKALKVDPTDFLSLYNTAVIYYEKGKVLNEEVHKMDMNSYHTEGKKKEADADGFFNLASERAEKALPLATDEEDKKNIRLLIGQVKKVQSDEQVYKSLHK